VFPPLNPPSSLEVLRFSPKFFDELLHSLFPPQTTPQFDRSPVWLLCFSTHPQNFTSDTHIPIRGRLYAHQALRFAVRLRSNYSFCPYQTPTEGVLFFGPSRTSSRLFSHLQTFFFSGLNASFLLRTDSPFFLSSLTFSESATLSALPFLDLGSDAMIPFPIQRSAFFRVVLQVFFFNLLSGPLSL